MSSLRAAVLGTALAAVLLAARARAEDGRLFSGTWTLVGTRTSVTTEGARRATIVHASGSLVITKGESLGRGFLGELIGFDDGGAVLVGRAVFTDEKGEKVFATLTAQPLGTGRTATGTITGGTGRWTGLGGEFTFSWKSFVESDDEQIHALTVDVQGRVRRATGAPKASGEAPK